MRADGGDSEKSWQTTIHLIVVVVVVCQVESFLELPVEELGFACHAKSQSPALESHVLEKYIQE